MANKWKQKVVNAMSLKQWCLTSVLLLMTTKANASNTISYLGVIRAPGPTISPVASSEEGMI